MHAQLSVTSIPDILFSGSNQTRSIVEGSVIWLYCEVNSTSSTHFVTWNKDGGCLVQDVPHIILRTSTTSSSTTLILVLDNIVSSDAGLYQCNAQDGLYTASGTALTITGVKKAGYVYQSCLLFTYLAVLASSTGVLRIVSGTTFFANRLARTNGDNVTLNYIAGHVGNDTNNYFDPLVTWLKDGAPIRTTPTNIAGGSNGQLISTLSFTFQESDAGIYHCIFFGSISAMLYGTIPLRLDTGIVRIYF